MNAPAVLLSLVLAAPPSAVDAPVADPCAEASPACRRHRTLGVELLLNKLKVEQARRAACEQAVKAQRAELDAPPVIPAPPPPAPEPPLVSWEAAGVVGVAVGALLALVVVGVAR